MYKGLFYITFFRSTLLISIPAAIAITFVVGSTIFNIVVEEVYPILSILKSVLKVWCTAGLAVSLLYKETVRKNEYYFYYNAGISKIRLIAITFILYILSSFIVYYVCRIVENLICSK